MIVFYVSGHGYGHATRTNAIIQSLRRICPRRRIAVRTRAPRRLFGPGVEFASIQADGGMVESEDALSVDLPASARRMWDFQMQSREWLISEAQWLRASRACAIVADIPHLPGELARSTCIPAIATGNFLWDWIFEPLQDHALTEVIRAGYSGFSAALRMPLSHLDGWNAFPSVVDVPFVAPSSRRPREEIRKELGLRRTTVLIAGRARMTNETVGLIRRLCPNFDFLLPEDADCFSDLVRASDIAVGKLGYSLAAECIAEGVRLVYPPRSGFREESEISAVEVPRLTPALPIPHDEWRTGKWRPYLENVMALPSSGVPARTDGADVCARHLLKYVDLPSDLANS